MAESKQQGRSALEDAAIKYMNRSVGEGTIVRIEDYLPDCSDELKTLFKEKVRLIILQEILSQYEGEELEEVLHLDMELPTAYISDSLVREIGGMEPCGTANPRPLFACRDMRIEYLRVMGKNRNALRMTFAGPDGRRYTGVRFGEADCFLEEIDGVFGAGTAEALQRNGGPGYRRGAYPEVRADLAYTPEFNTFRGMTDIQLSVRDMRIHG